MASWPVTDSAPVGGAHVSIHRHGSGPGRALCLAAGGFAPSVRSSRSASVRPGRGVSAGRRDVVADRPGSGRAPGGHGGPRPGHGRGDGLRAGWLVVVHRAAAARRHVGHLLDRGRPRAEGLLPPPPHLTAEDRPQAPSTAPFPAFMSAPGALRGRLSGRERQCGNTNGGWAAGRPAPGPGVRRAPCRVAGLCRTPSPRWTAPRPSSSSSPADGPEMGIDPSKRYTATMETSLGTIVIALDAVRAPKTVNNFVFLALHHYYDGVIFHRIIGGFMCQGGDPTGTGRGGPGYRFEDELPEGRPVRARLGGHGQRRTEHQRQPVLHHQRHRRRPPAAAVLAVRQGREGHGGGRGDAEGRAPIAATGPTRTS